jgi:tetratricopeptide (TPR) repeat protein
LYAEVVDIARGLGDQESVAIGWLNLAVVAIERRKYDEARLLLSQALQVATTMGSQHVGQSALDVLAGMCAAVGDSELAERFFGAAEAQAERSGLRRDSADAAFLVPLIEQSRIALSAEACARAQAEGARWNYEEAIRRAIDLLSQSNASLGVTPC